MCLPASQASDFSEVARIAILFAPPIREARQKQFFAMRFLRELVIGYVCTGQVHFRIFGRISFMPSDCVALYSSDHRLCPSACVPTRRTPTCVREPFHRSMNMFVRALSNDNFQELWTVCQIPDGSLKGSSAPRRPQGFPRET